MVIYPGHTPWAVDISIDGDCIEEPLARAIWDKLQHAIYDYKRQSNTIIGSINVRIVIQITDKRPHYPGDQR